MAAKGIKLASAYIELHVDGDNIPDEVRDVLRGTERLGKKSGRDAGKEWGRGFGDGVTRSTRRTLKTTQRDLERFNDRIEASNERTRASFLALEEARKRGLSGSALANKERSHNAALREKRKLLRDIEALSDKDRASLRVAVDADTKAATAKVGAWKRLMERDDIEVKVRADMHGSHKQYGILANNLERIRRADITKIGVSAAMVSSLPALATGLAEVTAALVQLSQAALAVPGALAGAASSFGTLAFGVTGITDAYDSLVKASDEAKKSGGAVAQQARAQISASNGLRNAIRDEKRARDDVNRAMRDARRNLQDLNLELRGGVVSEKRAVNDLAKARQRLYSGDYSNYTDALLDVEEAEIRVEEVQQRNARLLEDGRETVAKGIQGSDLVVDANERLIRSQQSVVEAQGSMDAAMEGTTAQQGAAEAMGKLSTNAQEFVNALFDLTGPVMELRNLVQDKIFDGMADQLKGFAGKAMPTFEKGLGGIGDAWNNTFTEMFQVLGKGENLSILDRIFGNTEDAQNILNDAIDPLVEGLLTLTEAGTDALPRLADGFVSVAERFADFITEADEDGRLDEWINEGIDALRDLGRIAVNVGKMITGISDAADGNFLSWLAEATDRWQAWVNSADGQATLIDIFNEGKAIFEKWRPILEDMPGIFMGVYNGAKTAMDLLLPILNAVTSALDRWPGLIEAVAVAFTGSRIIGAIGTLSKAFGKPGKGKYGRGGVGFLGQITLVLAALELIDEFTGSGDGPEEVNAGPDFGRQATYGAAGAVLGGKLFGPPGAVAGGLGGLMLAPGLDYMNPPGAAQNGVLPGAPGTYGGQNPATVGGIPIPGLQSGSASGRTGSEYGLQNFTIGVKRLIEQRFPQIQTIGGYRQDRLTWHPHGKAIDVMIPGGTTRGGANPQGKALGDQIWAWLQMHGPSMGVNVGASLWQTDTGGDHYDHIHIATMGGGYPAGAAIPSNGDPSAGARTAPTPSAAPAPAPSPAPSAPSAAPSAPAPSASGPPAASPPSTGNPMEDLLRGIPRYDSGGWWENGTLGINTTGQDELVLNPDQLQNLTDQGVDPNTLIHGASGGAPGPAGAPMTAPQSAGGPNLATEGLIPAMAGNTDPVGQGGLSNFLDLGESFVHGLIDTAADLGSMAVSAAAAAGTSGAGAAAGPAASAGIKMAAEAGKRGVSWGYDMAGIWGEALIEQLMPFGAPHWAGTNPMSFMPQGNPFAQFMPKQPGTMGQTPGNTPQQNAMLQTADAATAAAGGTPPVQDGTHPGSGAPPGAAPPPPMGAPMGGPGPNMEQVQAMAMDPSTWLSGIFGGTFDQGGVLPPESFGVNLSKKPEYIFTQKQLTAITQGGGTTSKSGGGNYHFYAQDVEGMFREYNKHNRRQSRQYAGRP